MSTGGSGGSGASGASGGQGGAGGSAGGTVQAGTRIDTSLNPGWVFLRSDAMGAETPSFNDSAWAKLDLPHTWNALDGEDGPTTPYYRGIGWYRKHYTLPSALAGQR
ncbi:MAG TPA: hypothetical protein VHV51_20900, partial [Polyangiaceae bacterium]|nr:hypothetical protein [Polyangiaceae bacterium]